MTSVHCSHCKGMLGSDQRFTHEPSCKHEEIEEALKIFHAHLEGMRSDLTALALVDHEHSDICVEVGALTQMAKAVKASAEHDIIRMHVGIKVVKFLVDVIHESVGERLQQINHKVVKQ